MDIGMTLEEYLGNDKIKCSIVLIKENWERLLNSNSKILEQLEEWKTRNVEVKINSLTHADSFIRDPSVIGHKQFFYNDVIKMYVSYEINIMRDLCTHEKRKYGIRGANVKGISSSFELPLSMWLTVNRCDVQNRINANKNQCKTCGQPVCPTCGQ